MEDNSNYLKQFAYFLTDYEYSKEYQPQYVRDEVDRLLSQNDFIQAMAYYESHRDPSYPPEEPTIVPGESSYDKFSHKIYGSESIIRQKTGEIKTLREECEHARRLTEISESKRVILQKEYDELLSKTQETNIKELMPKYVETVTEKLLGDAAEYKKNSWGWILGGVVCVIAAIIFNLCSMQHYKDFINLNSIQVLFLFTRGAVVLALLCWVAHFCFSMAKNFTSQVVRRKDTMHSIRFGELFLKIFGSSVTKEETINVFKEWNSSGVSSFNDPVKDLSINSLKDAVGSAMDVTKGVADVASKVKSNSK